jgi:diguanylate cyclase (GGDEF)-like protein/PAS domain S-box-containing protein
VGDDGHVQLQDEISAERSAEIQRALLAYSSEFMLFVTRNGTITHGSENDVLGYPIARLGSHVAEFLHADDLPRVFELIENARGEAGYRDRIQVRARHADGSWRLLDAALFEVGSDPVLGTGAVLRVRDITDEVVRDRAASSDDHERFRSLAESLPLGILSADARSWVVFCNEAAQQIFNLPSDQLMGHGWERLVHADDQRDVVLATHEVVRSGLPRDATFRIQTGLFTRWANARFVPLGSPGSPSGWIATVDDVTDRQRAETELTHQATHDPLTGLPNRLLLEDRLQQACARVRGGEQTVSVLFIDLDDFKLVNDTFGHHVGDQVLIEIASRLRQVVRSVDTVARLGGDEFVAFCEALPEHEVREVAQRIRDSIGIPLMIGGDAVRIGASIGVETTNDPTVTFAELLARADQAMYRQKRAR